MIVFAAIVPHPPTSIEGIGTKQELAAVKKTIDSFAMLREDWKIRDPMWWLSFLRMLPLSHMFS